MSAKIIPFPQPRKLSAQDEADLILEMRIEMAHECLMLASGVEAQRYWFDEMARLVKMRSPAQIQRMERLKGLA